MTLMKEFMNVAILKHEKISKAISAPNNLAHLSGGGEMGALMRSIDWPKLPLVLPKAGPCV